VTYELDAAVACSEEEQRASDTEKEAEREKRVAAAL
jgi:hypothetical protein